MASKISTEVIGTSVSANKNELLQKPIKTLGLLICHDLPKPIVQENGDLVKLYSTLLHDERLSFNAWQTWSGEIPHSVNECDAWLISGSPASAYDNDDWIVSLRTFIRQAYSASKPMVGICFGHQLIAHTLGGVVNKHKGQFVAGVRDYMFVGEKEPLSLMALHGDQVLKAPGDATTIASAPYCAHAALRYGDKALTFQIHPEFTARIMKGFIKHDNVVSPMRAPAVVETLKQPLESGRVASLIKNFVLSELSPKRKPLTLLSNEPIKPLMSYALTKTSIGSTELPYGTQTVGLLVCHDLPQQIKELHGDLTELYTGMLRDDCLSFKSWQTWNGELPDNVHECDAWVITGSPAGAYDEDEWVKRLRSFIRDAYDTGVPMVGICFGHQAIAYTLGGVVKKHNSGFAAGVREYNFVGEKEPLSLMALHGDQVLKAPSDATTIASAPYCAHAALRYGDKALSFQNHPEFTAGVIEHFINDGIVPAERAAKSIESLKRPLSSAYVSSLIKDFLLKGRTGSPTLSDVSDDPLDHITSHTSLAMPFSSTHRGCCEGAES